MTTYKIDGKEYKVIGGYDIYRANGPFVTVDLVADNGARISLIDDPCEEYEADAKEAYAGDGKFRDPCKSAELLTAEEWAERGSIILASHVLSDKWTSYAEEFELDNPGLDCDLRGDVEDALADKYEIFLLSRAEKVLKEAAE